MCLSCTSYSAVDLNEARAFLMIFSEVTVGRMYASREHCQSTGTWFHVESDERKKVDVFAISPE